MYSSLYEKNQTQTNTIIQNTIPLYPEALDKKVLGPINNQQDSQNNSTFDIKSLMPLLSSFGNGNTTNMMQALLPAIAPNLPFDPQMLAGITKTLGLGKKKKEEPTTKTSSYIKASEYEFE